MQSTGEEGWRYIKWTVGRNYSLFIIHLSEWNCFSIFQNKRNHDQREDQELNRKCTSHVVNRKTEGIDENLTNLELREIQIQLKTL